MSSPAQESAKFIRLPSQEVVAIIPEKLKVEELKINALCGGICGRDFICSNQAYSSNIVGQKYQKELISYITGLSYSAKDVLREFELSKENRAEDTFYVFSAATREDYRRNRVSFALTVELYKELKRQGYRYVRNF